jgi:hypothetical protein
LMLLEILLKQESLRIRRSLKPIWEYPCSEGNFGYFQRSVIRRTKFLEKQRSPICLSSGVGYRFGTFLCDSEAEWQVWRHVMGNSAIPIILGQIEKESLSRCTQTQMNDVSLTLTGIGMWTFFW